MEDKQSDFSGAQEKRNYILGKLDKKITDNLVKHIPSWLQTYHLTLLTIPWSILIILFGFLAKDNIIWLWASSLIIFLQYLTDLLDGPIGRYRNTGLVKWGYFMDHFLDYIFLCSTLLGYSFVYNDHFNSIFFILAIVVGFMVSSYLDFAATNKFTVSHYGISPTEVRFFLIFLNTFLIFFDSHKISKYLPAVLFTSLILLIIVIYKTQKNIWQQDMLNKKKILTKENDHTIVKP